LNPVSYVSSYRASLFSIFKSLIYINLSPILESGPHSRTGLSRSDTDNICHILTIRWQDTPIPGASALNVHEKQQGPVRRAQAGNTWHLLEFSPQSGKNQHAERAESPDS
jgi:hypothetical protein